MFLKMFEILRQKLERASLLTGSGSQDVTNLNLDPKVSHCSKLQMSVDASAESCVNQTPQLQTLHVTEGLQGLQTFQATIEYMSDAGTVQHLLPLGKDRAFERPSSQQSEHARKF